MLRMLSATFLEALIYHGCSAPKVVEDGRVRTLPPSPARLASRRRPARCLRARSAHAAYCTRDAIKDSAQAGYAMRMFRTRSPSGASCFFFFLRNRSRNGTPLEQTLPRSRRSQERTWRGDNHVEAGRTQKSHRSQTLLGCRKSNRFDAFAELRPDGVLRCTMTTTRKRWNLQYVVGGILEHATSKLFRLFVPPNLTVDLSLSQFLGHNVLQHFFIASDGKDFISASYWAAGRSSDKFCTFA